jgi:hypothetical protein
MGGNAAFGGVTDDGPVRLPHRFGEEIVPGSGEARLRFGAEALDQGVDRDLGGDFALQMAAHAVGHHHQHGYSRLPAQAARSWLISRPPMRLSWTMV